MQVNEATDPQRIVIVSRAGSTHSLFLEGPPPARLRPCVRPRVVPSSAAVDAGVGRNLIATATAGKPRGQRTAGTREREVREE